MQYKWLNHKNNEKLIVFFNGWGMDEKIVSHLNCSDYDVLVFFDYESFDIEKFDFEKYKNKYLIAWSMGVYVCNYYYELIKNFDRFAAVNGTQKPIDDNFGIPEFVYGLTVNNFNDLSCSKFMKKISPFFDLSAYVTRNTQALKNELISIRDLKVENYVEFNKTIISKKDKIFPFQNQMNYWETTNAQINISEDGAHYIFNLYQNWEDLL